MVYIRFDFDPLKAKEIIVYLAKRRKELTKSPATIRDILKLMYFADRLSLQKFGRFLCNNNYVAMEQGPVPSEAYDLIKEVREKGDEDNIHGFEVYNNYRFRILRDADLDYLSDSDILCMNEVLEQYGSLSSRRLMEESHDSVWKNAWDSYPEDRSVPIKISSIIETLSDNDNLLDYLIEGNCD
ncbi:MAG: SocA family protein [Anaerolineaceae bacterium]|nr:SocA family protein [Anaerolineaceae bacterium]